MHTAAFSGKETGTAITLLEKTTFIIASVAVSGRQIHLTQSLMHLLHISKAQHRTNG